MRCGRRCTVPRRRALPTEAVCGRSTVVRWRRRPRWRRLGRSASGRSFAGPCAHLLARLDGRAYEYLLEVGEPAAHAEGFSNYLSGIDLAWAAKLGTGKTLSWPAGEGAEGNPRVAAAVYRTAFSIGYVEQAYSAANGYVRLPAQIQHLARTTLQRITGPSGTSLLS